MFDPNYVPKTVKISIASDTFPLTPILLNYPKMLKDLGFEFLLEGITEEDIKTGHDPNYNEILDTIDQDHVIVVHSRQDDLAGAVGAVRTAERTDGRFIIHYDPRSHLEILANLCDLLKVDPLSEFPFSPEHQISLLSLNPGRYDYFIRGEGKIRDYFEALNRLRGEQ